MSIEWVMPSNHLILCRPLLLPSIFPSIRVFSNESFSGASPVLRAEEWSEYNTVPCPHSSTQQIFVEGLLCARHWLGRPIILIIPRWLCGKESACQGRRCKRDWFDLWVRKILEKWQPTPVFLPGKFHGQRSLVGYSPWDLKELDTTEAT